MALSIEQASRDFLAALKDMEIPEGDVRDDIAEAGLKVAGATAVLKGIATFIEYNQELETIGANKPVLERILGDKQTGSPALSVRITDAAIGEDPLPLIAALKIRDDPTITMLRVALNNLGGFEAADSWRQNLDRGADDNNVDDGAVRGSARDDPGAPPPPSARDISDSARGGNEFRPPADRGTDFGRELSSGDAARKRAEAREGIAYWELLKKVEAVYDRTLGAALAAHEQARQTGGRRQE